MDEFFTKNKNIFNKFLERIEEKNFKELNLENRELIVKIITQMRDTNNQIRHYTFNKCSFNIRHIGNSFLSNLDSHNLEENWDNIISDLLRFSKEFELRTDYYVEEIHKFLLYYSNIDLNKESDKSKQIYFALNKMPFNIMEDIYSEKYRKFKENLHNEINDIVEKELPNKKIELNKLKDDCNNYVSLLQGFKKEFSFLSLNQAFNKLEKSKQIARAITLILLIILAMIIVYIPYFYYEKSFLIEQMSKVFNISIGKESNTIPLVVLFSGLIPMVFIETIFIYYFKIVLNKYNSITDQIVQLETKQAIMQFIESYVDYKKDKGLKTEDLSKFEDIVFSQISPNLKDVPNAPDLVSIIDGISKAIKRK